VLELADSYAACRRVHREHGRSYYLATRLLPAAKRPHVHALYAFTRWADEIVDAAEVTEREQRLEEWGTAFAAALGGGEVTDPLLPAVCHTVRTYDLDLNDVDLFLRSMATDLKVTNYATYDDLLGYMKGSAAAIGTMMLPILGVVPGADRCIAREAAQQLGFAFQLTNFIRDVREDLDRGRIYLPEEDLDRFGVSLCGNSSASSLAGRGRTTPLPCPACTCSSRAHDYASGRRTSSTARSSRRWPATATT
jgi:phytoene synthase